MVLIQLPISAPGLTPPPGAHWLAPHPPPARSAREAVVCRLPRPRALAAQQRRRLSRRTERAEWHRVGESRQGAPRSDSRLRLEAALEQRGPLCNTHTPRRRDTQTRLPAATLTEKPGSARAPRRTRSSRCGSGRGFAACAPACTFSPGAQQPGPAPRPAGKDHSWPAPPSRTRPAPDPSPTGPLDPSFSSEGLQEPRALPNPKPARANAGHRVRAHPLLPRAVYASLCPIQESDRGLGCIIVDHSA